MQTKRKSSASKASKSKRQQVQRPEEVVIRDGPGFTQLEVPAGQCLIFVGCGSLQVLEGTLSVAGKIVTPECAPIKVLGGGWAGSALQLAALPSNQQASGSSTDVAKAIIQALPSDQQEPSSSNDAPAFQVFKQNDPQAPAAAAASHQWQQVAAALASAAAARTERPLVVAICGSKGVGKSTFSRLLANSLLNTFPAVGYLDTDCGQPEFTTPGLVSLALLQQPVLGPPHLHQQQPLLAFSQGDVSPQSDPEQYLRCVQQLQQWWAQHGSQAGGGVVLPLVVNSHGWIRGLGLDMLADMLAALRPTHVVQIQAANSKKNLPAGIFWSCDDAAKPDMIQLAPAAAAPAASGGAVAQQEQQEQQPLQQQVKQQRAPTAAESKALQWLAWARQVVAAAAGDDAATAGVAAAATPTAAAGSWDSPEDFAAVAAALAAAPPFEISIDAITVECSQSSCVQPEQLPYLLNGSVVALLGARPQGPAFDAAASQQLLPRPCLGMGLVRAVDMGKRLLYVLTDVAEGVLEEVEVLQVGRLELPHALLQTAQLQSPYLSLFCLSGGASGAGAIKSRNNLQRISLLAA